MTIKSIVGSATLLLLATGFSGQLYAASHESSGDSGGMTCSDLEFKSMITDVLPSASEACLGVVEIDGRPMIELAVENLRPQESHQFVFVCKPEHIRDYALEDVLRLVAPGCRVVPMSAPTAGALCSQP